MTERQRAAWLGRLGGAAVIRGPGRSWGIIHVGPAEGVCSVDDLGCGYCYGVPCKNPKPRRAESGGEP